MTSLLVRLWHCLTHTGDCKAFHAMRMVLLWDLGRLFLEGSRLQYLHPIVTIFSARFLVPNGGCHEGICHCVTDRS